MTHLTSLSRWASGCRPSHSTPPARNTPAAPGPPAAAPRVGDAPPLPVELACPGLGPQELRAPAAEPARMLPPSRRAACCCAVCCCPACWPAEAFSAGWLLARREAGRATLPPMPPGPAPTLPWPDLAAAIEDQARGGVALPPSACKLCKRRSRCVHKHSKCHAESSSNMLGVY